ncbi:hypothetical protein DFH29DRAFT_1068642 [Suillus ampliporus]|nr:hypothetical protein DFH29DRAFT_1068642 [Suillus ampliporus]
MPGFCQAYELVGGVFAKTSSSGGIHNHSGSRSLISSWLPSSSDPGHTLVRNDIGISARDFAIGPSQDLIALVKTDEDLATDSGYIEVYIRTIFSNIQHPEASSPILRTLTSFPMTRAFIQIVDDVVGMMFWMELEGPHITIWNWKTVQMLVSRESFDASAVSVGGGTGREGSIDARLIHAILVQAGEREIGVFLRFLIFERETATVLQTNEVNRISGYGQSPKVAILLTESSIKKDACRIVTLSLYMKPNECLRTRNSIDDTHREDSFQSPI